MKKFLVIVLTVCMVFSMLVGCGGSKEGDKTDTTKPSADSSKTTDSKTSKVTKIVFPHFQVGQAIGADYRKNTVAAFNEKYKGKYELVLEEVPGDQNYNDKIKNANNSNELPAIFEVKDGALAKTIFESDKVLDLKPYIDADPEWKKILLTPSVDYCTYNGKIISAPLWATGYVGLFYNKDMFAKAGIKEFPKTWEELFVACDKLKAAGFTPVSMQTIDSGWTTNLWLTAMIATHSPEGFKFMKTKLPDPNEFKKDFFVESAKKIQKLLTYTTPDAVGGNYEKAANNFCQEKTAMIANGPWMIGSFKDSKQSTPGFMDKVGAALYPGSVAISEEGAGYSYFVSAKQPKEVQEGAVAYLKMLAEPKWARELMLMQGSLSTTIELTDEQKKTLDPVSASLSNLVSQAKIILPPYQAKWDNMVQGDGMTKGLPQLLDGKMTPQKWAEYLSELATSYKKAQ